MDFFGFLRGLFGGGQKEETKTHTFTQNDPTPYGTDSIYAASNGDYSPKTTTTVTRDNDTGEVTFTDNTVEYKPEFGYNDSGYEKSGGVVKLSDSPTRNFLNTSHFYGPEYQGLRNKFFEKLESEGWNSGAIEKIDADTASNHNFMYNLKKYLDTDIDKDTMNSGNSRFDVKNSNYYDNNGNYTQGGTTVNTYINPNGSSNSDSTLDNRNGYNPGTYTVYDTYTDVDSPAGDTVYDTYTDVDNGNNPSADTTYDTKTDVDNSEEKKAKRDALNKYMKDHNLSLDNLPKFIRNQYRDVINDVAGDDSITSEDVKGALKEADETDKKIQDSIESSKSDSKDSGSSEYVEYTYKPGDNFGTVIQKLGLDTGKGMWGPDGDVAYYTQQLVDQGLWANNGNRPGNIPIGTTIKLKKRK